MSGLELYSLGIVKSTKLRDSNIIEVIPIEKLPLIDGDISSDLQTSILDASLPDNTGTIKTSSLKTDISLTADWLPLGQSNRMTSPDVVQGETVLIFTFSDTNEYYWTSLFTETNLRRLETVVYGYGDLKEGTDRFDIDSSYYLRISTHDKAVNFHTGTTNNEPYSYDVSINTELGTLTIKDDIENSIELRSKEGVIEVTSNNEVILNSSKVTINATEEAVINTPLLRVTGDMDVVGGVSTGGGASVGGSISSAGNISSGGNIVASGTVSGTNI